MSSEYPSDEAVRKWNRALLEILKREHPEMDPDPQGVIFPPEAEPTVDEAAPPIKRKRRATAPPGIPLYSKAWPIIQAVATEHDVDIDDLLSHRRFRNLVVARRAAFAALVDAGYSLSATGRLMRRDHTTVMYGMRKVRESGIEARP